MNLKNLAIGSLLATSLVFVGCGDDDMTATDAGGGGVDSGPVVDSGGADVPVIPPPGTCADGSCFFVADQLSVPAPDEDTGSVIGANLDDEITTAGDPGGCGKPDFNHPDGTLGVDNALARILPVIETMLDEPISDQLTAQIAAGSLLITIKLEGVDSMNDAEVTGTLYPDGAIPGDTAPVLTADGGLAPDQTIDIDSAPITINGSIIDGRFIASLDNFPVMLPLEDAPLVLNVSQALFSADLTENGLENGEISGSLSIDELSAAVGAAMLADIDEEAARGLLQGFGDLEPNAEGTICARISLGLGFNAIPAVEGVTR
ncbi:MAG: hypothetical protein ACI9KE_001034 [Polyangiales bacterium]|jgi:hypothetical protein